MSMLRNRSHILRSLCIIVGLFTVYLILAPYARIPLYRHYENLKIQASGIRPDVHVGEITSETQVIQSIPVHTKTSGIAILFATYARVNSGDVTVRITGEQSGDVYADIVLNAADMQDNSFVSIPFEHAADRSSDNLLSVKITSNCNPGSAVTIWSSSTDSEAETLTMRAVI